MERETKIWVSLNRIVAYADDFVTERKSIASLDRFDCTQSKMNLSSFLWIKPSSFSPTLVSSPPHRGACIPFFSVFINENMQRWSGSIIQVQCQKAPLYPFQTIVQCVSKLTERDVFYQTQNHMMKFGLYPLCPPKYRHGYSMETLAILKVQNDMFLNLLRTQSHRARVPRLIR